MGKRIKPDHEYLQYTGRIDFENYEEPIFVFPYSGIKMNFEGTSLHIALKNNHAYEENYLGYIIDGEQNKILLPNHNEEVILSLAENLEDKKHEVFVFKRQAACHEFTFLGFEIAERGNIVKPGPIQRKCMEFYGDSVTTGEVAEALEYIKKEDPVHNGEYSNAYCSYATITARMLNARVNLVAQGGIALLDGIGYFNEPETIGIENIYDKIRYNPNLGPITKWDFKKYTPHVVVVAIGQNDAHPLDFMKEDPNSETAQNWKNHYKQWMKALREHYPKALIVLKTTILNHHPAWDRAIGKICVELGDPKIVHFLYSENGRGTPGHIRTPEAEQMALELSTFLRGFGDEIWQD